MNNKIVEPKLYTGVKYNFELDELLTFPLKIRDLTPTSLLAIEVFHMDRDTEEGEDAMEVPIASTVVDLFDCENRLRQGTWDLLLHKKLKADYKLDSNITSGLPANDNDSKCLNNALKKIEMWRKKQECQLSWIDKASQAAIHEKMYDTLMDSGKAFLEISLPEFGRPVIFCE